MPAVIFGNQLNDNTDGLMGIPEVIFATGFLGMWYAIFAGQALVLVGVTGPVVFFTTTVFTLADTIDAPFLQFMAWICIWSGLMHIVVAASGATVLVQRVTNFSGEIFGFFISVAYIYLGLKDLVKLFDEDDTRSITCPDRSKPTVAEAAFAGLCLAVLMFVLSNALHVAQTWRFFNGTVRELLSSYGMVASIVFCTALSYIPTLEESGLKRLNVPDDYTYPKPGPARPGGSSWLLDITGNGIEAWHIAVAIVPAFMLLVLFFFDHNVSSILAQSARFNLKKPAAFHWDFAVLGVSMMLCGFLGIPPGNGLIPQAPLHVRSLATIEEEEFEGVKRERYSNVLETRWSALFQSALCFLTLFLFEALGTIPQAVLAGTFLYMGVSGLPGNELWDRLQCLAMQPGLRPDFGFVRELEWPKVVYYTLIQLLSVVVIFLVSFNFFVDSPPIAVTFPLLIAVLIPVRTKLLPMWFTEFELDNLDRVDEAEDISEVAYEHTEHAVRRSSSAAVLSRSHMIAEEGVFMDDTLREAHAQQRLSRSGSASRATTPGITPRDTPDWASKGGTPGEQDHTFVELQLPKPTEAKPAEAKPFIVLDTIVEVADPPVGDDAADDL
eukprot:TRINITY_DN60381_c0_g1_i1.p1 TRINITY_DN60381_c0_g1~~TRINITY_DN60381_c0_g1_i1.p1  ORF type:complete len:610 (+),score=124.44 TRINITY_DN60381_c0_g1_i1:374-2203(+)